MTADIVFLNGGYKGRVVKLNEIVTIEVSKNDLSVRLIDNTTFVIRGSLVKCMKKLPEDMFFIIGRNCLVNLAAVGKVDTSARNITMELKDGRQIMVSRIQSKAFKRQFAL